MIASRLLEYEIWTRLNARRLGRAHGEEARALIQRVALIELAPPVLERALEPFPVPVRTLDALHLASITFLLERGQTVELATYDQRLLAAAEALSPLLHCEDKMLSYVTSGPRSVPAKMTLETIAWQAVA